MPIFAIYAYEIHQREEEAVLFEEQEGEDIKPLKYYDTPEACFGSFFQTGGKLKLNVLKGKGKGRDKIVEWEPYQV